MSMIPIPEIKAKNSLIAVGLELGVLASSGVSGGSYRGNCITGHTSQSQTCFTINGELAHCFSCKWGGDVISFAQQAKFGRVDSSTWLPAVQFLAHRGGIALAIGPQSEKAAEDYRRTERAIEVLNAAVEIYHANMPEDIRNSLRGRGFSEETIVKNKLGFCSGYDTIQTLRSKGFNDDDMVSAGIVLRVGGLVELMEGRIIFPYWQHQRVVYLAGRETVHTPKTEYEIGRKYKKLLTHNPEKRASKSVAPGIKNRTLFNQNAAFGAKELIITEGIADCLILDQYGFSAISPATVRFAEADSELVLKLVRRDQTVFIANDNEPNKSGEHGALAMAKFLSKAGIQVRIIEIPLTERHHDARRDLGRIERDLDRVEKEIGCRAIRSSRPV